MFSSRRVAARDGSRTRVSERAPWSPAQLVVAIVGLVFVVLGGVALARAGLHFNDVPLTRTQVAGLWFTDVSALVTLVGGVVMLVGAIDPDSAKATMWLFGVVLIAFGLIVAISPQPFTNMWGFNAANGVFYVVAGAVLVLAGAVSPVFYSRRSVVSRRRVVDDEPGSVAEAARPGRVAGDDERDRALR